MCMLLFRFDQIEIIILNQKETQTKSKISLIFKFLKSNGIFP